MAGQLAAFNKTIFKGPPFAIGAKKRVLFVGSLRGKCASARLGEGGCGPDCYPS
jgi:hypothetical protein